VKARLHAIALQRAVLAGEIEQQRTALRETLGVLRNDIAFAGLGLVVGRVLVRRPWLRALALGALAAVAAKRLAAGPAAIAVGSRPAVRRRQSDIR
jgi:hypothetical protein